MTLKEKPKLWENRVKLKIKWMIDRLDGMIDDRLDGLMDRLDR